MRFGRDMRTFIAAVMAMLGITAIALAQSPGVPTLSVPSPTGLEQVPCQTTGPQITTCQLRQMRDAAGYVISAATSGTVTFGSGQSQLVLTAGTTISSLAIALTAAPSDGQMNCFYNKSAITTLTMSATSPQTLNDALTSTSATTRYCYTYSLAATAWNRLQ